MFTNNSFQKCCCFHAINLLLIQLHLRHQRSYCFSGLSLVYRDLSLLYKIINRIHKFLIKWFYCWPAVSAFTEWWTCVWKPGSRLLFLSRSLAASGFPFSPLPFIFLSSLSPFSHLLPLLLCCECRQCRQVSNSSAHLCIKRLVLHLSQILKSTCLVTTSGFL